MTQACMPVEGAKSQCQSSSLEYQTKGHSLSLALAPYLASFPRLPHIQVRNETWKDDMAGLKPRTRYVINMFHNDSYFIFPIVPSGLR